MTGDTTGSKPPPARSGEHAVDRFERRRLTRVQASLPAEIVAEDQTLSAQISDVGIGGMFLEATQHPPDGASVSVRFAPRPGAQPVELPGVVRWVTPGGFGVQFLRLGARETRAIVELLETYAA